MKEESPTEATAQAGPHPTTGHEKHCFTVMTAVELAQGPQGRLMAMRWDSVAWAKSLSHKA